MNKFLIASLIVITIVIVLVGGYLFMKPANNVNESKIQPQSAATPNSKTYTLTEVKSHNNQASCWSVVNNKVYNLTDWINKHPGGPSRILGICGTDGSSAFNNQHEGERRPANELKTFYIGDLLPN